MACPTKWNFQCIIGFNQDKTKQLIWLKNIILIIIEKDR